MSRIIAYEEKAQIAADDYLVVDSSADGTRKIKATNIVSSNLEYGFSPGYINVDGTVASSASSTNTEKVSQLIPVSAGDSFTYDLTSSDSTSKSLWFAIFCYDDNWSPIGTRFTKSANASTLSGEYTVSAVNAKYMRMSYRSFNDTVDIDIKRPINNDVLLLKDIVDGPIGKHFSLSPALFTIGTGAQTPNTNNVEANASYRYRVCFKDWVTIDKPVIISCDDTFRIYTYYKLPGDDTVKALTWSTFAPINVAETKIFITVKRVTEDTSEKLNNVYEFVSSVKTSDYCKSLSDVNLIFSDFTPEITKKTLKYLKASIMPGTTGYINYDSVNHTLTVPKDSVLVGYHVDGNKSYKLLNSGNEIVLSNVDASSIGSSLLFLIINTDTFELSIQKYNYVLADNECLISIFRIVYGNYKPVMNTSMPWSVNGNPYNIVVPDIDQSFYEANVKSINHRGWNSVAPENTLPAFKLSKRNGFRYVETDVCSTLDNVLVLLHDGTINRTARNSDGSEIANTINIADITYQQALEYDFGIFKSVNYAGTKIPKFDDFCALCKKIGLHPYIELKTYNMNQSNVNAVVNTVRLNGLQDTCTYISFTKSLLEYVKTANPRARLGLLISGDITSSILENVNSLKTDTNEVFLSNSVDKITADGVALCADANIPLEAYGVNATNALTMNNYITGATADTVVAGRVIYDANIN